MSRWLVPSWRPPCSPPTPLDDPLALGPGYDALRWALDPDRAVLAVIALGTLRVVGTTAVVGGGGAGGLFIPLVIQGALVGRGRRRDLRSSTRRTLFPVVGMAAFLGAGYRVPLAAVVFVAEFTGRPGFVVPGLIAAVVAQLVMGRNSVSPYQVAGRVGHLERRLELPLAHGGRHRGPDRSPRPPPSRRCSGSTSSAPASSPSPSSTAPGTSAWSGRRSAAGRSSARRGRPPPSTEVMRTDVPVATTTWVVSDAIRAMEAAGVDRLAVCDGERFVGVIGAEDIVRLEEILRESTAGPLPPGV